MAIPKCPVTITCDNQRDVDSPFGNFSSEAPDTVQFVGNRFPNPNPNNPLGPGTGTDPNTPNPPPAWFANGCLGFCFSTDSQAAADACAASQAYICANDGGSNGGGPDNPPNGPITGGPGQGGPGTPTIFFNLSQTCSFTCPDGSLSCSRYRRGQFHRVPRCWRTRLPNPWPANRRRPSTSASGTLPLRFVSGYSLPSFSILKGGLRLTLLP